MDPKSLQYAIGVDLGGTKIELGIVDENGMIHQHQRLETQVERGPQAIEDQILESICILQKQAKVPILGVGIGAAGQIDSKTGEVIFAPNLKWHHIPLQDNLEKALQIPVRTINDVRAITLGEWQYGAGKGCKDLLCIFLGTGIGGGVVSGGHLLTGCSNTFAEIGHITIDMNGPLCTCGKKGCFEVFASGWGISARAQEILKETEQDSYSQKLLKLAHDQYQFITAKVVIQAYKEGNEIAVKVIEQAKIALIAGMASLVNAFNPCRLILGGGLIDGLPEFVKIINEGIRQTALKAATEPLEVVRAQLGKEVGVIGSATSIFNLFKLKGEVV